MQVFDCVLALAASGESTVLAAVDAEDVEKAPFSILLSSAISFSSIQR